MKIQKSFVNTYMYNENGLGGIPGLFHGGYPVKNITSLPGMENMIIPAGLPVFHYQFTETMKFEKNDPVDVIDDSMFDKLFMNIAKETENNTTRKNKNQQNKTKRTKQ
jgi:hypothetical protein